MEHKILTATEIIEREKKYWKEWQEKEDQKLDPIVDYLIELLELTRKKNGAK